MDVSIYKAYICTAGWRLTKIASCMSVIVYRLR